MIYQDKIYGEIEIKEPVVLDLIENSVLQRLKGVDQAGYSPLFFRLLSFPLQGKFSRFEHSLGVLVLLKRYGASLEEQIAGLIHDVSHSAFSHSIDYILDGGSGKDQSYQDSIFDKFIRKSEIPSILEKYGLDVDYILNEDNFPLLEKKLPDLCADRIDYSLRGLVNFKEASLDTVNHLLNNLKVKDSLWVFKDLESARQFGKLFKRLNTVYYSGLATAVMFRVIGNLLRYALEKKYLLETDLYATDDEVLSKIRNNLDSDDKLKFLWNRMDKEVKFRNDPKDYDESVFLKSRIVDPLFEVNSGIKRLSEVDKDWAKIVERESKPKQYFIKFES